MLKNPEHLSKIALSILSAFLGTVESIEAGSVDQGIEELDLYINSLLEDKSLSAELGAPHDKLYGLILGSVCGLVDSLNVVVMSQVSGEHEPYHNYVSMFDAYADSIPEDEGQRTIFHMSIDLMCGFSREMDVSPLMSSIVHDATEAQRYMVLISVAQIGHLVLAQYAQLAGGTEREALESIAMKVAEGGLS